MPIVVRLQDERYRFICHRFTVVGSEQLVLLSMLTYGFDLDEALDMLADSETIVHLVEQELDTVL